MKCKFVIHAVGPIWKGGKKNEDELLRSAIVATLNCAIELGKKEELKDDTLKRVCIPGISSAIYGFPVERCAKIFGKTVIKFVKEMTEE